MVDSIVTINQAILCQNSGFSNPRIFEYLLLDVSATIDLKLIGQIMADRITRFRHSSVQNTPVSAISIAFSIPFPLFRHSWYSLSGMLS